MDLGIDDAERRMYQLPLTGKAYSMDNKSVYHLLKNFLVNTSGWTWIEPYDTMENGHRAFLALTSHYNGQGELSKRTAMAKAWVKSLFYKNERSLLFEKKVEKFSVYSDAGHGSGRMEVGNRVTVCK
jgi:hypothetical protein